MPGDPRLVDVVLRPGIPADAIAYTAGASVPATWAQLETALAAAPLVSGATGGPGQVDEGALATDTVMRLAIGGDGPVVVCVLRGVELPDVVPVWRIERDTETPSPRCQRVDPDPAAVTRLVIDPTKLPP